jgi:hypothetical protein
MAERQGSAEVKQRGDAILIVANAIIMGWQSDDGAWHGEHITDWDTFVMRFSVGAEAEQLGAALRACLLKSRLMPGAWADERRQSGDYNVRLAQAFGLSSIRKLYPGMKDVSVYWNASEVNFLPTRNRRGGAFEAFPLGADRGHEEIALPDLATDEEFGEAIKEAIRRSL